MSIGFIEAMALHEEHALLIRKLPALQSRVSSLMQAHLAAERALEAEILTIARGKIG